MAKASAAELLKRFGKKRSKPFKKGENAHTRRRGQELQDAEKVSEMIIAVAEGRKPSDVLDDTYGDQGGEIAPTYNPDRRLGDFEQGQCPASDPYRPNRYDPSFLRKTSYNPGGKYPHSHVVSLDPERNGVTDESEGSRHDIVSGVVQPDPIDGHAHDLEDIERTDTPTSHHAAGNPTSYHTMLHDPGKDAY